MKPKGSLLSLTDRLKMSIISEALNKVQDQREKEKPPKVKFNAPIFSIPQKKKYTKILLIIAVILILVFILFISLSLTAKFNEFKKNIDISTTTSPNNLLSDTNTADLHSKENVSVNDAAVEKTNDPVKSPAITMPKIPSSENILPSLNGIMYSEYTPKAIVNGKIVT
ncbi:MAG: hypothetical protein HQL29_03795, partial [Candidatus Omnitrophica bacterium]|nr:hypothetical protein [Candidatus Omnitrophota bacterium]